MEEEKIVNGDEQPSAAENSASQIESPTNEAEKELDEKIKQTIGIHNLPSSEEKSEEEKANDEKDASDPNQKKEDVPEKKEEEKTEVQTEETPGEEVQAGEQPKKLDRRIAKLFLNNKLLRGEDDIPDFNKVALAIQKYPVGEKMKALKNLLAENKALRAGGEVPQGKDPWNQREEVVDLSEEDHEALIEAEADQRLQSMQSEIAEREWSEDLIKELEAHPEIDERSKSYNPRIATAVEKLALPYGIDGPRGMKTSEAYALVMDSIKTAGEKAAKDEKNKSELKKQSVLSGAVNASTDNVESKDLTWEEVARIQKEDPDRYMKMVREGKLPKSE
jgi:hypothetical protein